MAGLVVILCVAGSYFARFEFERRVVREAGLARASIARPSPKRVFTSLKIPRGLPLAAILGRLSISPSTTQRIVIAAQPVFDFRMLQAGKELQIARTAYGKFAELRYDIDPQHFLLIARSGNQFHAEVKAVPAKIVMDAVSGKVQGSLFDAVTQAGESPELALRIADIFSWDMDFYTDPRAGDTFRVVVQKKELPDGQFLAYGEILAAEYVNDGHAYRAVLFHDPQGFPAYYTPNGKSLKKVFLHSPLKFAARITSHFSYHRFHPILKIYRPHLGTDYGAPMGTPVQAIGDGRVIYAGWKGEDGRLIKLQHANGYETYYMHLSRILVRVGQRVAQGQTIGLVGMTGLATGPHLDFRIERHGRFLNFERPPLPPSRPVAKSQMPAFEAVCDKEMALLPQPGVSLASAAAPPLDASGTSAAPAQR